jgi:uncharacterized phage protein (TIGR02218 family)
MSFDINEQSEYTGRPRELYWFMRGTQSWRYTSSGDIITLDDQDYTPVAGLARNNIKFGNERSKNQLTVTMPRDTPIATEFIGVPVVTPVWLFVYRVHEGESDYRITWQGRIRFVEFKGNTATMTLDDLRGTTKKGALRYMYQNQCNNFTFDANCSLSEADFTVEGVDVDTITGSQITVTNSQINGFYTAGQVKRANGDRRFVTVDTKVGGVHTLELLTPFEGLEVGETIALVGGACRHTFDTCKLVNTLGGGTTDNSANYGGYPKVPRKNPFKSFY